MEEKFSKLFFAVLFIGVVCLFVKGCNNKKEIKEHEGKTICKYTFCKQFPKSTEAYVKYYVDNKLYRNGAGGCPDNSESKIDKYYELKYSTINPNKIIVDFSTEVKDSILIKELESKLEFKYWLEH